MPHASLESTGLSGATGETDSSQSLADSIFTASGPVMGAPDAAVSGPPVANAPPARSSLWNVQDLAAQYVPAATSHCLSSCLILDALMLLVMHGNGI